LKAELDHLTKSGIIEVSIRNPSVADYMRHWEGRAEKAEAERDALAKALEPFADLAEVVLAEAPPDGVAAWGFKSATGDPHFIL
ncbi:hypothetical protein H9X89_16615, partial [Faecalicatena contorta]|uniref:hypothetical protein n=1 Tax=Faecalicatena contorta TaxID=39482 RepID=UPI0019603655